MTSFLKELTIIKNDIALLKNTTAVESVSEPLSSSKEEVDEVKKMLTNVLSKETVLADPPLMSYRQEKDNRRRTEPRCKDTTPTSVVPCPSSSGAAGDPVDRQKLTCD